MLHGQEKNTLQSIKNFLLAKEFSDLHYGRSSLRVNSVNHLISLTVCLMASASKSILFLTVKHNRFE
jgi:hypothetical protein